MGSSLFFMTILLLAAASSTWAILLLVFRRHVILKPTYIIGFSMVNMSWRGVFFSDKIYAFLPQPWHYVFVIPVTALILLGITTFSAETRAREAWGRIVSCPPHVYHLLHRCLAPLLILSGLTVIIYFLYVPPWRMGLWVIVSSDDAVAARDAREATLKLLPALPRYIFTFNRDAIAPIIAGILGVLSVAKWRSSGKHFFLGTGLILLYLVISAGMNGSRGPMGAIAVVFVVSILLCKGFPLNPIYIVVGLVLILTAPTLVTLLRKGEVLTLSGLWHELSNTIVSRMTDVPTHIDMYHMDYAQRYGHWGIRGIPKLAMLLGKHPVVVDNIIMRYYVRNSPTGLASVGSQITNYANWGLYGGILVTICTVWSLDLLTYLYRTYATPLLVPAAALFLLICRGVNSGNFETIFITRGLVPGVILLWLLNQSLRNREAEIGDEYIMMDVEQIGFRGR